MSMRSGREALDELWTGAGGDPAALDAVALTGSDPVLPSSFPVGAMAQSSIAATALAAAEIFRARGGERQQIAVDMRHAAAEFRSERYMRLDDRPPGPAWDKIAGVYATCDGKVRIHTNFPHHRDGILRLLGCAYDRDAVAAALARWDGLAFETAAADAGLAVTKLRAREDWLAHPQGQAVARLPLIEITRLDDCPPHRLSRRPERPLSGVRVLDLTRVIAGPVAGRALAAHGADVMRVTAPHLPAQRELDIDTGRGKLSTALDLRADEERERLASLLREAQVFITGYRPGGLDRFGFSAADCARIKPGIVVATLSAYGRAGPWAPRHGFDSLVQTASGLNVAEAQAAGIDPPKELPAQALDHAAGYLMATGVLLALLRKAETGGSWHVQVSLARTSHWLWDLGRVEGGVAAPDLTEADVAPWLAEMEGPCGRLRYVRHAAQMSRTPPAWTRPPVPLGASAPVWPVEF